MSFDEATTLLARTPALLLLVACAAAPSPPSPTPVTATSRDQNRATTAAPTPNLPPGDALPAECHLDDEPDNGSILCTGDQPVPVNLAVLGKQTERTVLSLVNVKLVDLTTLPPMRVRQLEIQGAGVESLDGIERLEGLKTFGVYGTATPRLDGLARTKLEDITLIVAPATDLGPLSKIATLADLTLNHIGAEPALNLAGLTQVKTMSITSESLKDIASLSKLTQLEALDLSAPELEDLRPVAGLGSLRFLSIQGFKVTDLTPLSALSALEGLRLSSTGVKDLRPLHKLTNLKSLTIHDCPVSAASVSAFRKARPTCSVDGV